MEKLLQEKLNPDETLLWTAKPEAFETLDAAYKAPIVRKIMLVVLGIVILGGWYVSAAIANGVKVQPVAIVVCALPFLYSIWNDFSDAKKLRTQIVYGLTNQRILTFNGKQLDGQEYGKVTDYAFITDEAGHVSLVCGPDALKAGEEKTREEAVCGFRMNIDTDTCESYAMYGITEHVKQVQAILDKHIAV